MDTVGAVPLAPSVRVRLDAGWQRRHRRRARRATADLLAFARLDEERARAALDGRLRAWQGPLLRSPYWSGRLREAGLSPRDLGRLADLRHFPTLERATLRERWRDLPALPPDPHDLAELVAVQTSGSTGEPLTVVKDGYDCLHMWAVLGFWTAWLGLRMPPRPAVALLCSLTSGIEYSAALPLFHGGRLRRISLARPEPLPRLRAAAPAVLFSDPAGLHWLQAQERPPAPLLLLSSAQHLGAGERRRASRALAAPLVNYYACTEVGPIAWECLLRPARFHVLVPDVWVESVDGELLVTRLRGSVLPLLRYRTGDAGGVEREPECACGYRGWTITGFTGRRACAFRTPAGREVDAWRLAWLFKHYPLRAFRLTQSGAEAFTLELAPEAELPGADLARRLRRALALLGWPRPRLRLRSVPALFAGGEKPEPFRYKEAPP